MRGYSEQLCEILEPTVTGLGYELIGVQYFSRRERALVRVYIDHPAGIGLDDCESVSHQISGVLDVADSIRTQYNLEVSSPGLDRPLFKASHFDRFIGHRVRIKLNAPWEGRKGIVGELLGCQSNGVLIVEDGTEWAIPLDLIGSARLVPGQ
uniref:Ribosome maturation factor RimP n=1 Tax=Candidatus Kentrum sp. FM TaxID=2126340 RepID=A0A450TM17_9GAMM|nr:MAG: ribosome maturation factor RimP [Candidatus Kentron sp. FM]VFJ68809.1 MAG: ribosome maturation factor RimP [Candidatus Kentron sp. FM]VFK08195.1 MAG: ribosome maturation factor RimP [Candidatus Kentron sp. FM]